MGEDWLKLPLPCKSWLVYWGVLICIACGNGLLCLLCIHKPVSASVAVRKYSSCLLPDLSTNLALYKLSFLLSHLIFAEKRICYFYPLRYNLSR